MLPLLAISISNLSLKNGVESDGVRHCYKPVYTVSEFGFGWFALRVTHAILLLF